MIYNNGKLNFCYAENALIDLMCILTWPLNKREAGVDLVMIQASKLF